MSELIVAPPAASVELVSAQTKHEAGLGWRYGLPLAVFAGAVLLGSCGLGATTPGNPPANLAPNYLDGNTVTIPEQGCSGNLITDEHGNDVGVVTASHCHLRNSDKPQPITSDFRQWFKNPDGSYYMVAPHPIEVFTGESSNALHQVGEVKEFVLPAPGDKTTDEALGVFKGHTAEEVIKDYDKMVISDSELQALQVGTTAYIEGWPRKQPKSKNGVQQRQTFTGEYAGIINIGDSMIPDENVAAIVLKANNNETACGAGASGANAAVVIQDSTGKFVTRMLGPLSAFVELKGNSLASLQQADPSFPWSENKYFCGMSLGRLTSSNSVEVSVKQEKSENPGVPIGNPPMPEPQLVEEGIPKILTFRVPLLDRERVSSA